MMTFFLRANYQAALLVICFRRTLRLLLMLMGTSEGSRKRDLGVGVVAIAGRRTRKAAAPLTPANPRKSKTT